MFITNGPPLAIGSPIGLPAINKNSVFVDEIIEITEEIEIMAGPAYTSISSGGMITKIEAAKIATKIFF